jgi:hypothetical protein
MHLTICSICLDKMDKKANWWIHCLTSNYLSRWYKFTIQDVNDFQKSLETRIFTAQQTLESQLLSSSANKVPEKLSDFQEGAAITIRDAWWDFFFTMVGKYRDLYMVVDMHVDNFIHAYKYLSVPRSWLESIGYWGQPGTPPPGEKPLPVVPINVPTEDNLEQYKAKYPNGFFQAYPASATTTVADNNSNDGNNSNGNSDSNPGANTNNDANNDMDSADSTTTSATSTGGGVFGFVVAGFVGMVLGILGTLYFRPQHSGYQPIL